MTNQTTGPMRPLEPVRRLGGLRYWIEGEVRGGEGYLLIPGMGATLRHWTAVAQVLSAQHRTLAIDFPGFGRSKLFRHGEATAPTADQVVDSVTYLLRHLASHCGVGHSHMAVHLS